MSGHEAYSGLASPDATLRHKPSVVSRSGLSEREAKERLRAEGFNELPRKDRRTLLHIVLEVLREPMFGLLIAGGLIYLLLGDLKESMLLLIFALMSETRTERVLETLRYLTSPRACVIRDDERKRIRVAGRVRLWASRLGFTVECRRTKRAHSVSSLWFYQSSA
jgi:magnesium-transporting ATPase (P-type)